MTPEHKEALARGREIATVVKRYLSALEANAPRRGRRRTAESIRSRLDTIAIELAKASPLIQLQLVQERIELQAELEHLEAIPQVDMAALEAEFVECAYEYGESKGISYAAWREMNVEAKVLTAAGIQRTRRASSLVKASSPQHPSSVTS